MQESSLSPEATWTTTEELAAQQVERALRRAVDIVVSVTQAPIETQLLTSVFQAILERSEIPAPTISEIPARYN